MFINQAEVLVFPPLRHVSSRPRLPPSPHPYWALGPRSLGTSSVGAPAPRGSLPAPRALLPSLPGRTHFRRMGGGPRKRKWAAGSTDGNGAERLFTEQVKMVSETLGDLSSRRARDPGPGEMGRPLLSRPGVAAAAAAGGWGRPRAPWSVESRGWGFRGCRPGWAPAPVPRAALRLHFLHLFLSMCAVSTWRPPARPGPLPIVGDELARTNPKVQRCSVVCAAAPPTDYPPPEGQTLGAQSPRIPHSPQAAERLC